MNTKIMLLGSVIAAIVSFVALVWLIVIISQKGEELAVYTATIANQRVQEQAFAELLTLANDTAEQRALLDTYVLHEGATISFLTDLEQVAAANAIEFKTNALDVVSEDGLFDTLSVSFSIAGSPVQVRPMIDVLETVPYHSSIQQLNYRFDDAAVTAAMDVVLHVSLVKS